jgi:hypothetical protein
MMNDFWDYIYQRARWDAADGITPSIQELFSSACWVYFSERPNITGPPSRVEKVVEDMILLLAALSEGQGSVKITLLDVGAGGGFESGEIFVEHLRDGKTLKASANSPEELKASLMSLLTKTDDGLPWRTFESMSWDGYVLSNNTKNDE